MLAGWLLLAAWLAGCLLAAAGWLPGPLPVQQPPIVSASRDSNNTPIVTATKRLAQRDRNGTPSVTATRRLAGWLLAGCAPAAPIVTATGRLAGWLLAGCAPAAPIVTATGRPL